MTLPVAADFRTGSLAEFAAGCDLKTEEASDAKITAAVARMTDRFQDWTNDLYTATASTAIDVDAHGGPRLLLPFRTTAVTIVKFRAADGTLGSAQDTTSYRLHSSLNAAGTTEVQGPFDYLEIVPNSPGFVLDSTTSLDPWCWPWGPKVVNVTGIYGWTTPPADVNRAIAMLVWNHFKPIRADLGMASGYQDGTLSVAVAPIDADHPSGIRDVDAIVQRLRRDVHVGVG